MDKEKVNGRARKEALIMLDKTLSTGYIHLNLKRFVLTGRARSTRVVV
jgi:hypothetical protein